MGFADVYLLKAGLRGKLFESEPHPDLHITVTIPVYNESELERSLVSLFQCQVPDHLRAEVLVLINAPSQAPTDILKQNQETYQSTLQWISDHPHPAIDFHVFLDHSFSKKEAGVGLARKIVMDEAVRRFSSVGAKNGIITGMDADAVVESNYLEAIVNYFAKRQPDGCSIYFEHPLSEKQMNSAPGDSDILSPVEPFTPEVFYAITQYELHLRYYLQSIRTTGYPYAFHTVGSSFAVRADVYCIEGGMNRRKGGEDFYFIQKIAQRGNFGECIETRVIPSPRPSDRVPFGTGTAVRKLIAGTELLNTYAPQPFVLLRHLFSGLEILYSGDGMDIFLSSQSHIVLEFLKSQQFGEALAEIRNNSASFPAFRKRFWRWFNMFRIMKFLHFARENGYPDIPVGEAALILLKRMIPIEDQIHEDTSEIENLLKFYRITDRSIEPKVN